MDNFNIGDIISIKDEFTKNGVIKNIFTQGPFKYLVITFGNKKLYHAKIESTIATTIFKNHKTNMQDVKNQMHIVKAEWLDSHNGKTCSNCNGEIDIYYHHIDIEDFEYCPYCGAKMK